MKSTGLSLIFFNIPNFKCLFGSLLPIGDWKKCVLRRLISLKAQVVTWQVRFYPNCRNIIHFWSLNYSYRAYSWSSIFLNLFLWIYQWPNGKILFWLLMWWWCVIRHNIFEAWAVFTFLILSVWCMCVCVVVVVVCGHARVCVHACDCVYTYNCMCDCVVYIYIYVCVCVYFCISVCVYVCNANTHFPTGLFFSIHPTGHCGWHTQQWNTAARDFAETGLQEQNHWQMVSSLDDLSDTELSSERYWWGPRSQVVEAGETIPNTAVTTRVVLHEDGQWWNPC